jgi:hypothetical protein
LRCKQLTLNLLEPLTPTPSPPNRELRDAAARAEALNVLIRIIVQACLPAKQKEAADE